MHSNSSTYRFQFQKDFKLEDALHLVSYLKMLGAGTLYASPIFAAAPGSMHGYDTINPEIVNPELGTLKDLKKLSARLKEEKLGFMQDIVPNHMAFDPRNPWLQDLLAFGRASSFYPAFDIFFGQDAPGEQLMLPFLGAGVDDELQAGNLKFELIHGRLFLSYFDSHWPVSIQVYPLLLQKMGKGSGAFKNLIAADLGTGSDARPLEDFLAEFATLLEEAKSRKALEHFLEKFSADVTGMRELLDRQFYRLCNWRDSNEHLNFRRFFTVNALICLNIQDEEVFKRFHRFIKSLCKDGTFSALRVDHVDGLFDPAVYLNRLRKLAGSETPIYIEKILAASETLPADWPVEGSTGYDFLAWVNNLFTSFQAKDRFEKLNREMGGSAETPSRQLVTSKTLILSKFMGGELENLAKLSGLAKGEADLPAVGQALLALLVRLPVYRFYGNAFPLGAAELSALAAIAKEASREQPESKYFLETLISRIAASTGSQNADEQHLLRYYMRLMQFTGPVMAKGVEDTLMYTCNRFLGHNEVGDSPFAFGISPAEFHQWIGDRFQARPLDMNATSTHDTKRGEDVRARLNTLSEVPELWARKVKEWKKLNAQDRASAFPGDDVEYFIYQSLFGSYPLSPSDEEDYEERFQAYMQKALREGKKYSDWAAPDAAAEAAVGDFVTALLDRNGKFKADFKSFLDTVIDYGLLNSLSQLSLKCLLPGVPDIYQGAELWDLSLVDPDNRRPVDFKKRVSLLQEMSRDLHAAKPGLHTAYWKERKLGLVKLFMTQKLLNLRQLKPNLFDQGEYLPVEVRGTLKDHVFAFMRRHEQDWLLVAVPVLPLLAGLEIDEAGRISDWKDTRLILPAACPAAFRNELTLGEMHLGAEANLADLIAEFPVAVLASQISTGGRGAGVLLHITSLPSDFGTGDLGPEAHAFADFLEAGRQKFWQVLPLGPTGAEQSFSPYSSFSSFAGNTTLISPDLLVEDALLDAATVDPLRVKSASRIDFLYARRVREQLCELAYLNFRKQSGEAQQPFELFCEKESSWLDDFAAFVLVKGIFKGAPWYEWPGDLRQRKKAALKKLIAEHGGQIQRIKWRQFTFFRQWARLKTRAEKAGIQLIGDLPFYCAYDSADVWSAPELFKLHDDGSIAGQSGVPPDYFNANGQLWGMPVYNWQAHEETGFNWWVKRIGASLRFFDLLRLDHFRAFAQYWEVSAGAENARHGEWKPSPGIALLTQVKARFPKMPFIAEDLGEIGEDVFELRDSFDLPGMKVLQFGFGKDAGVSTHAPHNFSHRFAAYTGTHDNSTTAGWFKEELGPEGRQKLADYTASKVNERKVAELLVRMTYSSVASMAIIPMQDLLGLGNAARMNVPAQTGGNWAWRLKSSADYAKLDARLLLLTELYNR